MRHQRSATRSCPDRKSAEARFECPVVAIGVSPGELDSLEQLFDSMPTDTGMAFVVLAYLDPSHENHLVELLTRHSTMPVSEVSSNGMTALRANHIYVSAPHKFLSVSTAGLQANDPSPDEPVCMLIDRFLNALAETHRRASIVLILSGSGSDGALGLQAIKAHGGLVIAQEPRSASLESMPRNAIATGLVDHIAIPADMAVYILRFAARSLQSTEDMSMPISLGNVYAIISVLTTQTKLDFGGYKAPALTRRIARRMSLCQLTDAQDYLSLLEDNQGEADALANDFMIGVTRFFRDTEAFSELVDKVIRPLLASKPADEPLRIWVPGCASGEEAYSLVMLVLEHADVGAHRLKLFATDINPNALAQARAGVYPESIADDVSFDRLERFFTRENDKFRIRNSVRECVTFALQNVVSNPPFSRIDLISCRNLLIYLTPESQERVLTLCHFALGEQGYLFLGNAESVSVQDALFELVSKNARIYQRRVGSSTAPFNFVQPSVQEFGGRSMADTSLSAHTVRYREVTHQLLLKDYGAAAVLINHVHDVVYFHGPTHKYLNHHPTGTLTANLFAMAGLRLVSMLRETVNQTIETAQLARTEARIHDGAADQLVQITVRPVQILAPADQLLLVTFSTVPEHLLGPELGADAGMNDLELVSRFEAELVGAREELKVQVDEHVALQEAMSMAYEEASSINEELQSSEEELKSLNEQLSVANAQLKEKVDELQFSNDYTNAIIDTLREPFLVLDQNLVVKSANREFYRAFALTPAETINREVYSLGNDQWNIPSLRTLLEELLSNRREMDNILLEHTFPTVGIRSFLLNARHLQMPGEAPARILLAFEDISEREVTRQLKRNAETFTRLVDESPFGIYVVDSDFRIARVSKGAMTAFVNVNPLIGRDFSEAIHVLWPGRLASKIVSLFRQTLETGKPYVAPSLTAKRLDLERVESYEWEVHRVTLPDGSYGVVCYFFDSSDMRAAEQAARKSELLARKANRAKSEFLGHVSHEIRTPMSAVLGYAELLLNELTNDDHLNQVGIIKSSGESLLRLVDDLLDLSSIEAGKLRIEPACCELDVLLAEIVSQIQVRTTEKQLDLTLDYVGSLPKYIETDAGRVQQILLNLLSNAIKFTEKGGVCLRVEYLADPVPTVRFDVADTGIGMSESRQKKLFQPFERTARRNFGGTGLGLFISNRLAERLEGTLTVESTLHQGSSFKLTIPAGQPNGVELVTPRKSILLPTSMAELTSRLTDKQILIVDDQPAVRELLQQFVKSAGGRATTANNGQMALDIIADAHNPAFDAVILDLQMPVMDGLVTACRLRERGFTAPILAITADAFQCDRQQCLAAGCDAYMNKPIVGHALIKKLDLLMQGSSHRKVLVVDDSAEAADPLSRLLRIKGYVTQAAYNGATAMAAIDTFAPDVVLLDIGLPDMDGYQVADLIRQRSDSNEIELVALTGKNTGEDQQAIRDAGFKHHLVKPVDIEQLLEILQR